MTRSVLPSVSRLLRALVVALGLVALVSGCVSIPSSGPVVDAERPSASEEQPDGFAFDPRAPSPGASAADIVSGFLDAMEATPISTTVAKEYLTEDFASSWDPAARIITYADRLTPRGGRDLTVDLVDANWLDRRSAWRGALGSGETELDFRVTKEGGEWRISRAPAALVVSESWFHSRFTQVSLYFFDSTARTLVPEPVFVPEGSQLATVLVQDLMRGPSPRLRRTLRSFVPGSGGQVLSVPVQDGVAQVDITADAGPPSTQLQQLMAAQLAWTLRQDSSIERIQLTINDQPITFPDSGETFGVTSGMEFDPTGFSANSTLFALWDGRIVSRGDSGSFAPVLGEWGRPHDIAEFSADINEGRGAALTEDRTGILVGRLTDRGQVDGPVLTGTDLLRPAWDLAGRLWSVDAGPGGARVSYLAGDRVVPVQVPGISGEDVTSFLVSRDGTRLVAIVRGATGDQVVLSRLRGDSSGRITGANPATTLPLPVEGTARLQDLVWRTSTTVAVLQQRGASADVHTLSVDGASSGFTIETRTVDSAVAELVGAPSENAELYARVGTTLLDITGAEDIALPRGATQVSYPG